MNIYKNFVFPLLKNIDAETAHHQTLHALELAQRTPLGRHMLCKIAGRIPVEPVVVAGLTFPNVLGIAAGFDKDVRVTAALALLGFGHIEVGTLTPRPQKGNPRPRIFRLPRDGALINRMGFPNSGVNGALPRLKKLASTTRNYIIGVSMGKQKETALADAAADYVTIMRLVYNYTDYLAINISSPNTPGLRELQGGNYLAQLLDTILAESEVLAEQFTIAKRPLFLKIAPDLTTTELYEILDIVMQKGINGLIATNTTLNRPKLKHPNQQENGGLSGAPLTQRSTEIIQMIHEKTAGQLPIIGVGGVRTAADVRDKLAAGASLVQLYTSLIYEGPALAGHLLRELAS